MLCKSPLHHWHKHSSVSEQPSAPTNSSLSNEVCAIQLHEWRKNAHEECGKLDSATEHRVQRLNSRYENGCQWRCHRTSPDVISPDCQESIGKHPFVCVKSTCHSIVRLEMHFDIVVVRTQDKVLSMALHSSSQIFWLWAALTLSLCIGFCLLAGGRTVSHNAGRIRW